jgi:Protein of unknown function (DUF998)
MVRKVLLACGMVAALFYVAIDIYSAMRWQGYRIADQTISELVAVDAPTRPLLVSLGLAYPALWFAFGVGIWQSAGRKWALRVVAAGLIGKEVLGTAVALFFPMHLREVLAQGGGTSSDSMHERLTYLGVLCFLIAIGFGATAFGKRFALYSIGTLLALVVFGTLAASQAARMAANLPTPWMGVEERINAYGYMLWASVLAIGLLRARTESPHEILKRRSESELIGSARA